MTCVPGGELGVVWSISIPAFENGVADRAAPVPAKSQPARRRIAHEPRASVLARVVLEVLDAEQRRLGSPELAPVCDPAS